MTQQHRRIVRLRCTNLTYNDFSCVAVQSMGTLSVTLLCLAALTLNGCSSGQLLSTVEPKKETAESTSVGLYSKSTFGLTDISTFDVYADNDSIHLIVGGKVSVDNKQIKLSYNRSEDGGVSWQDLITLNNHPASINSRGNDVQLAAKGNHLLAVWQTKGELPSMGPMVSAYSEDNGKTWTQGANPAVNNAGDQSHIDLIADQNGVFHTVWLEDPEENGYQSLRYARSADWGKHWSQTATLDDSTCSCCWNTFALSPENELNILYRDMKPRDMALLQSYDDGKNWRHVSTVGEFGWQFDGCPHVGGALAYMGTGNPRQLHGLVWTGVEGKSGLYHLASNNNGRNWSTPQKIGNTAIHGDIAEFDGNIVAIWDEMEQEGSSIFYAKSEDNGNNWSTPTRLTVASNAATHPRLIATKQGLLALWTEKPSKKPSQLAWQRLE
ncbi:sialidase family protein [Methyloglobulus sp.]|uniref:sialidase family protein n=1 Tax=Methyloglobulus sp. TaxID=2518622 RepID=UPI0032B7E233